MADVKVPFDFDDSGAIEKLRNISQGLQGVDTNAKSARQSMQEAFAGNVKVIESNNAALDKVEAQLSANASATQTYSGAVKNLNTDMVLGNTVIGQTVNNLKAKAASLQGVIGGLKGAAAGANVLKVALISTGIGAIVVALGSLIAFLTRTERGMDLLARATGAIEIVLTKIGDVFSFIGESIFDSVKNFFINPVDSAKAALKSFGDFLIGQVTNRIDGVIKLVTSLGSGLKALFERDFAGVKKAAGDAAVAMTQFQTGFSGDQIRSFGKAVKGAVSDIGSAVVANDKLIQRADALEDRMIDFRESEKKALREIDSLKADLSDGDLTSAQRQAALNKLGEKQNKLTKDRIAIKQEEYNIETETNKLKISTNADLEKEKILAGELEEIKSQGFKDEKFRNKQQKVLVRESAAANKAQQEALSKLKEEYEDILKTLNEATQTAKLDGLFGADKLNEEARIAVQAITDLESKLKAAAKAAKQPFTEGDQFNALRVAVEQKRISEVAKLEEKAALDAIEREKVKTNMLADLVSVSVDERYTLEEQAELIKIEAERKALEERIKVKEEFRNKIADADKAAVDAEIEQLKLSLDLQGVAEEKITKEAQNRLIENKIKNLDQQQQIDAQYIQFIEESADKTLTIEQYRQKRLLEIEAEALNKRIVLLEQRYGPNSDEVKYAKQQAEIIAREIGNIGSNAENPFGKIKDFLKEALNIDDAQLQAITEAVSSIAGNIGDLITSNTDEAIAENERLLESIKTRITDTESLLNDELEKQENGYANNVEGKKKELAELRALEAQAQKEKQELEQEQLKQQLYSDLLAQGSSIATGIAGILATSGTLGPIAGPILAASAIIAFLSIFKKYKAQSKALTNQKAYKGGALADYLHGERDSGYVNPGGYSDIPGRGNGLRVEGTNLRIGGNEFLVKEGPAQKYQHLLEAINADKLKAPTFGHVSTQRHLVESGKVIVRREAVRDSQNSEGLEKAIEKIMDKHADKMIGYMKNKRQIAIGRKYRMEYTDNRIKIIHH